MKSYLNSRQYDILAILLKDAEPTTVGELAHALDMHPRVIQYNLNAIDAWLQSNHVHIIRRSGMGLRIELTPGQRLELTRQLSKLENIELVLSTRQRRRSMLLKLLAENAPISSGRLADQFGISRTTVINDLVELQILLKKYHLEMGRTPHKGFQIEGRASLKRFARCALYCEEHAENKIPLDDLQRLILSKSPFDYLVSEWFDILDVEFVSRVVGKVEQLLKIHYSRATRIFLQYHILLLLADIRKGQQIAEKLDDGQRLFEESRVLPTIKAALESRAGAAVSESELQLLALHFHCLSAFQRPEPDADAERAGRAESELASALVKEISLFLNPYLQVDRTFRSEIIDYLDRCLPYSQRGFFIPNPFQEKARAAFPETYDIVERICSKNDYLSASALSASDITTLSVITTNALERIPQISQRDVRVALVSDADEALTVYTRERILSKFPWFRIVGMFRDCDIHRLRSQNVNLILSTTEPDAQVRDATIVIDPFVTEADVEHIKRWIDQHVIQKGSEPSARQRPALRDILLSRNIVMRPKVRNWEEAVYAVGDPLVHNGDLGRSYLDAIIRVKKTYGPYSVVSPHIALLHAKPSDGVMNLCVGLMILKDGVEFGATRFDPVHLVFILGITDSYSHLNALQELAGIIRTKTVYEGLRQCGSAEDALQVLLANSKSQ
jgi:transcriptional antiterminator/mannitol/fructose-specific phosphotransferase system IIA component (Ntr-type)